MKNLNFITLGLIAISMHITASDDTSLVNNYADDAVVQIQAVNPTTQATQEPVTSSTQKNVPSETAPAQEVKTMTTQDMQTLLATPATPTTTAASEVAKATTTTPVAASTTVEPMHTTPATTPPVTIPTSPIVTKVEEIKPAPAVTSSIATPATQTSEQVKIIKIYPVYDAVRSAIRGVHNAAQDMINYVYNFITKPRSTEKAKEEVKSEHKDNVVVQTGGLMELAKK